MKLRNFTSHSISWWGHGQYSFYEDGFSMIFLHIPRPMWKTWIPLKHLFHHAEKITFLSISDFIRAWILCILTSPGAQHSDSMGKSEQYWAGLNAQKIRGQNMFSGYQPDTPGAFCLIALSQLTQSCPPQSPSRSGKSLSTAYRRHNALATVHSLSFSYRHEMMHPDSAMMRKSHLACLRSPISVVLVYHVQLFFSRLQTPSIWEKSSRFAQHKQILQL